MIGVAAPSSDMPAKRVLAISSGGGHWVELLRLRPAWAGQHVIYVTTDAAYRSDLDDAGPQAPAHAPASLRFHAINDANRWNKIALVKQMARIAFLLLRYRPHVVISTGAAPGYFALRLGRMIRARTIWVDSIANAAELSMAGQIAGRHADLWLTQWEHLAGDGSETGPHYHGAVL